MNPTHIQPSISIIVTCYNDGAFLDDAINSVLKIDGIPYQLIIVNDGSDDHKTLEVLTGYKKKNFHVIDQVNSGAAVARNTGISAALAPYILLLDADNFIEPEYIYEGVKILDQEPHTGVVYADCFVFGLENGERRLPDFDFPRMLAGNYVDTCAVFRKTLWTDTGGFDVNPGLKAHHDWDFWIRIANAGWHFHHLSRCLYHYRVKQTSMTSFAASAENKKQIIGYLTAKYDKLYKQYAVEITRWLNIDINQTLHLLKEEKNQVSTLRTHVADLNEEVAHQQHYGATLMEMVQNLELRLHNIETSRWFKIKSHLVKIRDVFKSKEQDEVSRWKFFGKLTFFISHKGRKIVRHFLTRVFKYLYLWLEDRKVVILIDDQATGNKGQDPYQDWMNRHMPNDMDLQLMQSKIPSMGRQPLMSIILPVYNPPIPFFRQLIDSVKSQIYTNWELCIADDASTEQEVKKVIEQYAKADERIKVIYRKENGHISACTNSALDLATGEFVVFVDQDDLIAKDALYEVVQLINEKPDADLIYSDEDKIDENNLHSMPHFKPQWSPDNLLSRNYFGHLVVMRNSLVQKIGGFRLGFEGSQDYDIVLRFTELTRHIYHIPKVLYHWRIHTSSAASSEAAKPYAYKAAQKALTEALKRRDEPGTVDFLPGFRGYSIRYKIKEYKKVSVIIPTKNKANILATCLESIFEKTIYPDYEIILVDNRSDQQSLFDLVKKYETQHPDKFRYLKMDIDFNFSKLMNEAVRISTGDYLLLLNNDTEVIAGDWMNAMVEQAQRKSIGAVGAKLLYHNDTIQHAGVIIGLGGAAGHSFVGIHKDGPGYFNYINTINNYSAVTAACLMCRKEVYLEVGGFDEKFVVEYNDVDFCLKLVEAGYYNVYLPHVMLYHYESLTRGHPKSSKESFERHVVEIKRFQDKWKKYIENDPCFSPNLSLGHHDFHVSLQ